MMKYPGRSLLHVAAYRSLFPRHPLAPAAILLLSCSAGLGAQAPAATTAPAAQTIRPIGEATEQGPKHLPDGFDLPNGWRITPAGKAIATIEDLVLNLVVSPDNRIVIASHSGYLPHGIDVFDTKTQKQTQHIPLKTTWLGMTWSLDGHTLYVSGGNATGAKNIAGSAAPIYEFHYEDGKVSSLSVNLSRPSTQSLCGGRASLTCPQGIGSMLQTVALDSALAI